MSIDVSGEVPPPTTQAPKPGTFTVPLKGCCGVLAGEVCDCASFAAEAQSVFAKPIFWDLRTHSDVT